MKNQPIEKSAPKKRAKRAPKAFLIENGVWTEFTSYPKPQKPSKGGQWLREHRPLIEILDMRAVLK
ncbi:hypothetical protein FACS1894139_12130 [Planctomycetales bacterium]|nr:hypothetical protein FACS1894107_14580 [Planctomycetales bacterium]GHT06401.1 hypothetical protein FACS1894139_12130 [Planctomycetales bacterium]GHV23903.1 hypothetical protein AGMMS49959_18640 [Planctomycetales bacterium]